MFWGEKKGEGKRELARGTKVSGRYTKLLGGELIRATPAASGARHLSPSQVAASPANWGRVAGGTVGAVTGAT